MARPILRIELPNLWAMSDAELSLFTGSIAMCGTAILDSGAGALVSLDCVSRILDALRNEAARRGIAVADPPFQRIRPEVAGEEGGIGPAAN